LQSSANCLQRCRGTVTGRTIRVEAGDTEDGFAALGYAREDRLVTKTQPPLAAPSRDWLAWIDVRGTDFNRNTFGSDLNPQLTRDTAN
jgi:hypothetical protein